MEAGGQGDRRNKQVEYTKSVAAEVVALKAALVEFQRGRETVAVK